MTATPTRKILRLDEISQITGIPKNTIRWMRQRGDSIPLWLPAGRIVCNEDELIAWLDAQKQATSAKPPAA